VEEAIDEDLLVEGLDQLGGHGAGLDRQLAQGLQARDLDAFHERHGEHGRARVLVVHGREQHVGVIGEVGGHALEAGCLVAEVGLARQQILELLMHPLELLHRHEPAVHAQRPTQHPQVDLDDGGDVRVEELDRQALAAVAARLVDLTEGRGRDRLARERRERLVGRLAEGAPERLGHLLVRLRRNFILKPLELLGVGARQERAHDREDLPQLDVDAAQPDEAAVHAARVAAVHSLPAVPEALAAKEPQ
jgi:hypothetical protein